ncbi:MAG TPA: HAMP domain-containing histidine kinase [Clostridiales bacterium]|nr:HAMP domain-containing histidine kinase [Clostridiales bacterium]
MVLFVFILILSGATILFLGRSSSSFWYTGILSGMTLLIIGFMVYFSKIGGISGELTLLFFFSENIQDKLCAIQIGTNMLSTITIISRALVIFCFAGFSICESNRLSKRTRIILYSVSGFLSLSLALTFIPGVYGALSQTMPQRQLWLLEGFWRSVIISMLILSVCLLILNLHSIKINWLKRRIMFVYFAVFELMCFYVIMGVFTPLQISRLDRIYFMLSRIFYYSSTDSIKIWRFIVGGSILFTITSVVFLLNYLKIDRTLSKPNAKLEKKLLTGDTVVRTFSHGVKNQILANQVLIEDLISSLSENRNDRTKELIFELSWNNRSILQRVNDLNDFFKSKKLVMQPVEVSELILRLINDFEKKEYPVNISFKHTQNCMILADIVLIRQTITNIINNAIDAVMHKGDEGNVEILTHLNRNYVIIEIRDNGCGIPKQQLRKIFAPFYTTKNTRNNWGIGLAYTQKILNRHGGTIRVESIENEGTTVYLFLPRYERKYHANEKRKHNQNIGRG